MFPTSIIVHRVKWKGTFWAAGDETSSDFTDELLDHYDMAIHFGQVQYMYILRAVQSCRIIAKRVIVNELGVGAARRGTNKVGVVAQTIPTGSGQRTTYKHYIGLHIVTYKHYIEDYI
jgi:hypothetical protein